MAGRGDDGDDGGESILFHAGLQPAADGGGGAPVTAGGRVLTAVGLGESVGEARRRAYGRIAAVGFENGYYRRDIAEVSEGGAK